MTGSQSNSDSIARQIASLLSEALFEKTGSGANIRDTNNPLLGMIADHMDKNPNQFGKPHDANGKVRNWRDELGEDNYLNNDEKEAFTKGLESLLEEFLGTGPQGVGSVNGSNNNGWNGTGNSSGTQELLSSLLGNLGEEKLDKLLKPSGSGMSFSNDDKDVLKEVARFMDMHPEEFGKPDDANGKVLSWRDELGEDNYLDSDESKQFQKAIDMIKGEVKGSAQGNSLGGLFPNAEQNFLNGGAGNTLKTDASIAAGNLLSVLMQQSTISYRV
ncbi:DNA-binding protein [Pseudomonas sp. 22526]|uniref:DNA-binding protein n=1 Tax=Pseudomonas sp. 22526 TaxID=3453937 RepID=UPI003F837DCE